MKLLIQFVVLRLANMERFLDIQNVDEYNFYDSQEWMKNYFEAAAYVFLYYGIQYIPQKWKPSFLKQVTILCTVNLTKGLLMF